MTHLLSSEFLSVLPVSVPPLPLALVSCFVREFTPAAFNCITTVGPSACANTVGMSLMGLCPHSEQIDATFCRLLYLNACFCASTISGADCPASKIVTYLVAASLQRVAQLCCDGCDMFPISFGNLHEGSAKQVSIFSSFRTPQESFRSQSMSGSSRLTLFVCRSDASCMEWTHHECWMNSCMTSHFPKICVLLFPISVGVCNDLVHDEIDLQRHIVGLLLCCDTCFRLVVRVRR